MGEAKWIYSPDKCIVEKLQRIFFFLEREQNFVEFWKIVLVQSHVFTIESADTCFSTLSY